MKCAMDESYLGKALELLYYGHLHATSVTNTQNFYKLNVDSMYYLVFVTQILLFILLVKESLYKPFSIGWFALAFISFYLTLPSIAIEYFGWYSIQGYITVYSEHINYEYLFYCYLTSLFLYVTFKNIHISIDDCDDVVLLRPIIKILFGFNIIIMLYSIYQFKGGWFNRDLFYIYESAISSQIVNYSKVFLLVFVALQYSSDNKNRTWFYTLPIILVDIVMLGRTYIMMAMVLFLVTYSQKNKITMISALKIYSLLVALIISRALLEYIMSGSFFSVYKGQYFGLGEAFNSFGGMLLYNQVSQLTGFIELIENMLSLFKPIVYGKYIVPWLPESIIPAMAANNLYEANFNIYGLAGGLLLEMSFYHGYFYVSILLLVLNYFIYRVSINVRSIFSRIYILTVIISLAGMYRWSFMQPILNQVSLFIFYLVPLSYVSVNLVTKITKRREL